MRVISPYPFDHEGTVRNVMLFQTTNPLSVVTLNPERSRMGKAQGDDEKQTQHALQKPHLERNPDRELQLPHIHILVEAYDLTGCSTSGKRAIDTWSIRFIAGGRQDHSPVGLGRGTKAFASVHRSLPNSPPRDPSLRSD